MTNEEAAQILKERFTGFGYHTEYEIEEAFDMAILALEQKTEDAISRKSAIDAIDKAKSAISQDGEYYVAKINAQMNIQQLPSINVMKKEKENENE